MALATAQNPLTREELTDLISDAISDSIDMDWTSSIGARHVVDALVKEGLVSFPEEVAPFDIKTATACPKCGLEAKTLLHRFCQHAPCPVRDGLAAAKAGA